MNLEGRLRKVEKHSPKLENIVKEITINFINMDGTISSTMVKKVGNNHKVKK